MRGKRAALAHSALFPFLVVIALAAGGQTRASEDASSELVFLTWPDYIEPKLVEAFERSRGVRVRFAYFETDDDRNDLMAKGGGIGFDLAVVNSPNIPVYRRMGWLSPVGAEDVPNQRYLSPAWIHAVPDAAGYAVPYFWGTTGIAYRADLVPEPIRSWRQFFQPLEALRGKVGTIRNARDMIGMALKSLGFSANSTTAGEIRAAEQVLFRQLPYLGHIGYPSLGKNSDLVSGELWIAMMYSGDALMLREHHPAISYVLPEEGSEIWIDYLAVLARSPRKALATDFIDFVNEPDHAARNALFVHYATPNVAASKLLPRKFLEDPVIYPSEEVLMRSEYFVDLPPEAIRLRNEVNTRVLSAAQAAGVDPRAAEFAE